MTIIVKTTLTVMTKSNGCFDYNSQNSFDLANILLSRGMGDGDRKLNDLMKLLLDELQARERAAASNLASGKAL